MFFRRVVRSFRSKRTSLSASLTHLSLSSSSIIGVNDLTYTPPHSPLSFNEWPTLGEMIDDGRRLVIFMDTGADLTQLEGILPEFQVVSAFSDAHRPRPNCPVAICSLSASFILYLFFCQSVSLTIYLLPLTR
jgi:hypothetical protein